MRVARHTKAKTASAANSRETEQRGPETERLSGLAPDDPVWRAAAAASGDLDQEPTQKTGRIRERRAYVRARLALPLSVSRVAGQASTRPLALRTKDISSSGAFFLYPQPIEPGTPLAIEVSLVNRRLRQAAVRMYADAHVVRAQAEVKPGWHGLAVAFDDIQFVRDEPPGVR